MSRHGADTEPNRTICIQPRTSPTQGATQRALTSSNRVFETYDDIINASCEAWNRLVARPQTITSIGTREWANIGQP